MESLKEMSEFLVASARLDLKTIALHHVLSVTGTAEGRELLLSNPEILGQLIILLQDDSASAAKDAALALINVSGDESGANALLLISESLKLDIPDKYTNNLILICLRSIMDKESALADPCCMILSNMTRPAKLVDRIIGIIENSNYSWHCLVAAFTTIKYNVTGASLHYLGPVFSNLSQSSKVRRYLMDKNKSVIQRLLPFTEYSESNVRRGGIVGTLKNCCFEIEYHEWLLGPEVDILSYLLLPLAGPEEFDEEDNEKLPISLQYLPETKKREPDPDIRIMLLEALMQLCATRKCREFIREKNAYIILRELHKWEEDKAALLACENVVDILIKTEDEISLDNLKEVEIPHEYTEKFVSMDKDFINGS